MTDSTFWKGLVLWFGGFAVLALVVGAVVGVGFLGFGSTPPAMDDFHLDNDGETDHTVRVEVFPTGESASVFSERVVLEPGETVSFENTTAYGRRYRFVVSVDGREPESFEMVGPDDLCTIEITVGSNATVESGSSCA